MQMNRRKAITMGALAFMSGIMLRAEFTNGAESSQIERTDLAAKNAKIISHQNALDPSYADAIHESHTNATDIESAS